VLTGGRITFEEEDGVRAGLSVPNPKEKGPMWCLRVKVDGTEH